MGRPHRCPPGPMGAPLRVSYSGPLTSPLSSPLPGSLSEPLSSSLPGFLSGPLSSPLSSSMPGHLSRPLSGSLTGSLCHPLPGNNPGPLPGDMAGDLRFWILDFRLTGSANSEWRIADPRLTADCCYLDFCSNFSTNCFVCASDIPAFTQSSMNRTAAPSPLAGEGGGEGDSEDWEEGESP